MENKIQHSKPVPPFVRFCAANIPMVFDDSLSYYEALCALWKWLQTDVIDVINNNARVTEVWREELTTFENNVTDEIEGFETVMRADFSDLNDAFDTLKAWIENYFDNLDVQQEINNKLDQMVEDGVLQEIITTYIQANVSWTFDTVDDMVASTNLVAGSFAKTLGYYSLDDTGGALYKVVSTADADEFQIAYGDNLYLQLVPTRVISSVCMGDPETDDDDSALIQKMFDYVSSKKLKLYLRSDKTYNLGDHIKINSNLDVDFNGATFKMNDNVNKDFLYNLDNFSTQTYVVKNIRLVNGTFDGNNENNITGNLTGMCVNLYNGDNLVVHNFKIKNCQRNCFNIYETSNISITDIDFSNISTEDAEHIVASSCITIYNRIDSEAMPRRGDNVIIENITVDTYGWGVLFFLGVNNIVVNNLKAVGGLASPVYSIPITITECEYIQLNNIYIDTSSTVSLEINQNSKFIECNNVRINNSYQPVTLGPNTKPTSVNKFIKFVNCEFNVSESGYYWCSINNSEDVVFENCTNNKGGVASSYNYVKRITFKNCNFTLDLTRMYIYEYMFVEDTILNGVRINKLEPVSIEGHGNINCKLDCEIPFAVDAGQSTSVELPISLPSKYNFVGNCDITSYYATNTFFQYMSKYLYKITINSSDAGTLSAKLSDIGSASVGVTPSASTRGEIALDNSGGSYNLKGYVHLYS